MGFTSFSTGLSKSSNVTLSNGNLTATSTSAATGGATATHSKLAGKWYFEAAWTTLSNAGSGVGFRVAGSTYAVMPVAAAMAGLAFKSGNVFVNTANPFSIGSYTAPATICFAVDLDNGEYWVRLNGGNWNGSALANPATNTGGTSISGFTPGTGVYPTVSFGGTSGEVVTFNFGATSFAQTAPSGFSGWSDTTDGKVLVDIDSAGVSSNNNNITSFTASLAGTDGTNRVVIACVHNDGNNAARSTRQTATVTSPNLSWTRHKEFDFSGNSAQSGSDANTLEIWWAPAATQLSVAETITATFGAAVDGASMVVFAINGASLATPFDANVAVPATATNQASTAPTVTGVTTTSTDGLLIAPYGADGGPTGSVAALPTGFASAGSKNNNSPTQWSIIEVALKTFSAAQSSATVAYTSSRADWGMIVAAAVALVPVTGTWASTEAADIFAAAGGVGRPNGPWASTETADIAAMTGYPQLKGTWASTEAADAFAASGDIIPTLGLDGHAVGGSGGSTLTSATVTLSTSFANDVIVVAIESGGFFHNGVVSSISDTAGLTWKKRQGRVLGTGTRNKVELWWAHAPAVLTSDVITVHTTSSGFINLTAFAVCGANYTTPWDKNTQAGWFADNYGSGNPVSPVRTDAHDTLAFAFYAGEVATGGAVSNADYTFLTSNSKTESSGITGFTAVATQLAHTPITTAGYNAGFTLSGGGSNTRGVMTDAIVAAAGSGTSEPVRWYFDGYMPSGPGLLVLSGAGNSVARELHTFDSNEVIVCAVLIESATSTGVSSISDASGGTSPWHFRSRVTNDSGSLALEIWYAWATLPFTSANITVTCAGVLPGDTIAFTAVGINGPNLVQIWDGDGSLPAVNHHDGTPGSYQSVTGVETIAPNCLILGFGANADEPISGASVLPFLQTTTSGGNGIAGPTPVQSSAPAANIATEFYFTQAQLSAATVEFDTSPKSISWLMIADALPVGALSPPIGVWASTEGVDQFAAAGYVPAFGTWSSTEAVDRFTGAPAQSPYNSIGWLGWVPAFATWASTDVKDTISGRAWVLGEPLTGQWRSTESKDRAAISNRATVTGIWASQETRDNQSSAGFLLPTATPAPSTRKRRLMIIN